MGQVKLCMKVIIRNFLKLIITSAMCPHNYWYNFIKIMVVIFVINQKSVLYELVMEPPNHSPLTPPKKQQQQTNKTKTNKTTTTKKQHINNDNNTNTILQSTTTIRTSFPLFALSSQAQAYSVTGSSTKSYFTKTKYLTLQIMPAS